jgi:hypothetical protein
VSLGCVVAVAVLAMGCTESVRRAALVPHQQPIARSGQPMTSEREVTLGAPTVGSFRRPKEEPGANAGVEIPRWHFDGAVRYSRGDTDIGFRIDYGLNKGSTQVRSDQPNVDNGDVFGGGLQMHWSTELNPKLRLGFGLEVMLYSIPWVEYRTEVNGLYSIVNEERDTIAVVGAGVIPSFQAAPNLVLFGGVTVRNHPTIERATTETGVFVGEDEVEFGPANLIGHLGAEFTLGNGMRVMAFVYQPAPAAPARYGPTLGINLTIPIGRSVTAPPPPPSTSPTPTPPPGPMPPPAAPMPPPTGTPPPR